MKFRMILFLVVISFTFSSCTDELEEQPDYNAILNSTEWNILFFFNQNEDLSKGLMTYRFKFSHNGVVKAEENLSITSGSWRIDPLSDDKSMLKIKFRNADLDALNHEWVINDVTPEKLELVRFNAEGGYENLVLKKD